MKNRIKRIVAIVAILSIFGVTTALIGCNQKYGRNVEYQVEENGEITIVGYTDSTLVHEVVIPDEIDGKPVTKIGAQGIVNAENVYTIRIGKNVKVFYFLSAHLDTRSFSGVSYPMVNEENCRNLMAHADRYIVPEGVPSIIAGDMNTGIELSSGKVHQGYSILTDNQGRRHEWEDTYVLARQVGLLGETAAQSPATTNSSKGDKPGSVRIDHIFVEGFEVSGYDICQKKYKTENGTEHYPSDHFPVIVTLKF